MRVQVRYFASIREALGPGRTIDLAEAATLGALRDTLIAAGAEPARLLARGRAVRMAVDQVLEADESRPLHEGAEVAFFPPVTGG